MTQIEFAKHIQKIYPEMLQEDITSMMHVIFRGLRSALASGGTVNIPGLCVIKPRITRQNGRIWKNPQTLEQMELCDKVTLKMTVSRGFIKTLTDRLLNDINILDDDDDPTLSIENDMDPTLDESFDDL